MKYIRANSQEVFTIGKQGEKNATVVVFYKNPEFEDWDVRLTIKQNGTTVPYPKEFLTKDEIESLGITNFDAENRLFWLVDASDTAKTGISECELRYTQSDTGLTFSQTYSFNVDAALGNPTGTAPSGVQSWLNTITAAANSVTANIDKASTAAETAQTAANNAAASERAAGTSASRAETAETSMNVRINDFTTNLVMEGEEQPDNAYNKIWIKSPSNTIEIPTMEDFRKQDNELKDYVMAYLRGEPKSYSNEFVTKFTNSPAGLISSDAWLCFAIPDGTYLESFSPVLKSYTNNNEIAEGTQYRWALFIADRNTYPQADDIAVMEKTAYNSYPNPIPLNRTFKANYLLGIYMGSSVYKPGYEQHAITPDRMLTKAYAVGKTDYSGTTPYKVVSPAAYSSYLIAGTFKVGGVDPYMTRSQTVELINEMLGS